MLFIKKIDLYILKKFLLLFAGAAMISLFVLIMQFLWRYVDELIGKGLSFEILAKFFWNAGITLVPTALPLAVLLASLIAFGNMGEDLELIAMKAAGIPLKRIMQPVFIFSFALCLTSFVFQNGVSPNAQKNLARMVTTMKQTTPAIEIPEGVFYSGIPNVNLFVERKDAATGMLYNVTIYKVDNGFENAQIVMADSARLETTADKHFLRLDIFDGEQFENLQSRSSSMLHSTQIPYDRETFKKKTLLIDFDSDFDLMDAELFSGLARVKNLSELEVGYDSIAHYCDSVGRSIYMTHTVRYMYRPAISKEDTLRSLKASKNTAYLPDTLYAGLTESKKIDVVNRAKQNVANALTDLEWEKSITREGHVEANRHLIEWHQKFALALACLIFFFIGAPLGAIIRKGGLGLPTVISVIIFIIYYVINTSGMKLAREGSCEVFIGMWVSTFILTPLGIFISYKANTDSAVFNMDAYTSVFRQIFGIKKKRYITRKEVIIDTPDLDLESRNIQHLTELCQSFIKRNNLPFAAGYLRLFFTVSKDDGIGELHEHMEGIIERLSNSRDIYILDALNKYPEIFTTAHKAFHQRWMNLLTGIVFPLGVFFWLRIWRFRITLFRDLKTVIKTNEHTQKIIEHSLQHGSSI